MASDSNKKLILLYVLEVLKRYSDESHPLTQTDIIKHIENMYGMTCERKAIGRNIEYLSDFGYEVIKQGNNGCYLLSRDFESSELTFLIDAIFNSKSISAKHAQELTKKLTKNASDYDKKRFKYILKAENLSRTPNKQLFYTIDTLNKAISDGKKVSFNYNSFTASKEFLPRNNGKTYTVSPYYMANNNGKYYLICNYDHYNTLAHYKIDQITNIKILPRTNIKPLEMLDDYEPNFDITKYINEKIYMFSGSSVDATLKVSNKVINDVIDWFGENVRIKEIADDSILVNITANEQALIYWCLQYGENVVILSPEPLRDKFKATLNKIVKNYQV